MGEYALAVSAVPLRIQSSWLIGYSPMTFFRLKRRGWLWWAEKAAVWLAGESSSYFATLLLYSTYTTILYTDLYDMIIIYQIYFNAWYSFAVQSFRQLSSWFSDKSFLLSTMKKIWQTLQRHEIIDDLLDRDRPQSSYIKSSKVLYVLLQRRHIKRRKVIWHDIDYLFIDSWIWKIIYCVININMRWD